MSIKKLFDYVLID